jgi:spermidine synthase
MISYFSWIHPINKIIFKLPYYRKIHDLETNYHKILLLETIPFGVGFFLNGYPQTFQSDERIYHETLVHPVINLHKSPKSVLIVGCAEGCTLREVVKYDSVQSITMVDVDSELVNFSKEKLQLFHKGAFTDRRLNLLFGDIHALLPSLPKFDIIILALSDPTCISARTSFFSVEFFKEIKTHLNIRGILCTQAGEIDYLNSTCSNDICTTISQEFKNFKTLVCGVPSFFADWLFIIASDYQHFSSSILPERLKSPHFISAEAAKHLWFQTDYANALLTKKGKLINSALP